MHFAYNMPFKASENGCFAIVNFIALPYFSVFRSLVKSHGALSHDSIGQSKLANGNGGHERCTTVIIF